MKAHDAKVLLGQLCSQAKATTEIAKTARRNSVSLRGDNHYGNKFHVAIIGMTATTAKLDPVFDATTNQPARAAWEKTKKYCESLKSFDADGTTRMAAIKGIELVCQTEILPAMESICAVPAAPTIEEQADIGRTPRLVAADIAAARKMAQLYIIIHCYENSARRIVDEVLTKKLGPTWWQTAANAQMKLKVADRQTKEMRNKWLASRGTSPLFYIDWSDLLSLIRKYESDFNSLIPDYKFVEFRFEEMERLRNIVAHNGVLPTEDEFNHVILSFKQWCRQLA
jgi:hypothetical protein